jgi:general secretion pathway protein D
VHRALPIGAIAFLLGACALSSEQLSLPGSITGATNDSRSAAINARPGVPLSDAADPAAKTPRVYEGTGQFTAQNTGGGGDTAGKAAGKVDGNGVTLNLVGASVQEMSKTVLGDILQLNYTVSDKVKASITLSTAQPVSKEDLLKIFESILRSEGIGISVENGVYRVVPGDAAGGGAKWAGRGAKQVGNATAIVPLRYVAAAEMERILKAVAPQTSILRVDNARNLLLVSGSATDLASINDTVASFDLDWMRGMSFALLPVESADAEAIAKELDTVFANDTDSPTKGIVRFIPNTRLKSVLVISSRPEYLRKAEGWLRRIDLAGQATESQVQVYHVQNRAASELAVLLQKVYASQSGNRAGAAIATQPRQPASILSSGDDDSGTGSPLSAQGFPGGINFTQRPFAPGAAPGVGEQGAGEQGQGDSAGLSGDRASGISIVADDSNNSLIITATPREYKRVRQILSRIDIAGKQVLIEATIAEVTLTDNLKFGLKWFFEKGNSGAEFTSVAAAAIAPTFPGFSYFLNTPNVKVALDALNKVTTVNLVSSPSLMVLDNKKAVLQIGDEVPVATAQQQGVVAAGSPILNSISFRSTGVILGITPRISDNGRIQLEIEQEVSDAKATLTSDLNSPTISQRRIKTTVAVNDGQAIVLAGLMRDNNQVDHHKVPLIGDIPVVGNLFKSKDDTITRTELLIAITPHIVKDPRQVGAIADEFRDRMNLTTRPQRGGPPDRRENVDRLIVR